MVTESAATDADDRYTCVAREQKSLGEEFGGVVGILLFLSNNFGVAMYVLGFVEALQVCAPPAPPSSLPSPPSRSSRPTDGVGGRGSTQEPRAAVGYIHEKGAPAQNSA